MRAIALAAPIALTGCASFSRVASYEAPATYPNERISTASGSFVIRRHPYDSSILIRAPANGASFKAALIGDLTLGRATVAAQASLRPSVMEAAKMWAGSKGCTVTDLYQLGQFDWEAKLAC